MSPQVTFTFRLFILGTATYSLNQFYQVIILVKPIILRDFSNARSRYQPIFQSFTVPKRRVVSSVPQLQVQRDI